jgi:cytochrome b561
MHLRQELGLGIGDLLIGLLFESIKFLLQLLMLRIFLLEHQPQLPQLLFLSRVLIAQGLLNGTHLLFYLLILFLTLASIVEQFLFGRSQSIFCLA